MDFEITPDQQELVDSVRAVLARECPTALVRDVVENGSTPEQPWKSARELGWAAIDLPEEHGGLALGFAQLGLVIEQRDDVAAKTAEPGRHIVNFGVEDIEAAAAHLRTLDVEWLVHPEDRGVGWFATLIDPDGNYVQLIQMKPEYYANL